VTILQDPITLSKARRIDVVLATPLTNNAKFRFAGVAIVSVDSGGQLMLKTVFEIIATMADDPDLYRSDMRRELLELADTMPLARWLQDEKRWCVPSSRRRSAIY
jgi:hypothetical protein